MSTRFLESLEALKGFTISRFGKALGTSSGALAAHKTEYDAQKAAKNAEGRQQVVENMLKDAGLKHTTATFLQIAEALVPAGKIRETVLALQTAHSEDVLAQLRPDMPIPEAKPAAKEDVAPRVKGSSSPLHGTPKSRCASAASFLKS